MNRDQAIEAMKNGSRVTHVYFCPSEWVESNADGSIFTFEDGVTQTQEQFFNWRSQDNWEHDWEIWKEE